MARTIESILNNRNDFSPFLIHMTRGSGNRSALTNLKSILDSGKIEAKKPHGLFKYYSFFDQINTRDKEDILKAVCFTETPPNEVATLIGDIEQRSDRLDPYGLVFSKRNVTKSGGNPVLYLSCFKNKKISKTLTTIFEDYVQGDLRKLKKLKPLLALVETFGPGYFSTGRRVDFHWEREWRVLGDFKFQLNKVLLGLCPSNKIEVLERVYRPLEFIDPLAHPSHWGNKLKKANSKALEQYFRN